MSAPLAPHTRWLRVTLIVMVTIFVGIEPVHMTPPSAPSQDSLLSSSRDCQEPGQARPVASQGGITPQIIALLSFFPELQIGQNLMKR